MLTAAVAKKAFVGSLVFGVANLLAVDLVFGPAVFPDEFGGAGVRVRAMTDAAASVAVPPIEWPPIPPKAAKDEVRVVARFESSRHESSVDDALKKLADDLRNDGSVDVVLEGHSDPLGDAVYNRSLSLDRANWARDRLIVYGVAPNRIETRGLGAAHPLPTIDESVAVNRRVEARLIPRGTARPDLSREADAGKGPPPRTSANVSVVGGPVREVDAAAEVPIAVDAGVLP